MQPYPKLLFRGGEEITVSCASEEAAKALEGWRPAGVVETSQEPAEAVEPAEPAEPPTFGPADDGTGDEPTEGPADDQTHVRRARKKK